MLDNFNRQLINEEVIKKYNLKHIRYNLNTKGFIYTDRNNIVALVNIDKKDDDIWIQALEVFDKYKGKGISYELLDIAINTLKATKLSVNKNNEIAIHIYEKYGFKKYFEDDTMFYMENKL